MDDAPARIKQGPLSGRRVGVLAGPEFSDFQAYYLNLYLNELGARVCNLVIGWPDVGWKMTRPATSDTVQGTFGLRLDPIPTMAHGDRYTTLVFRDQAQLTEESVDELDALIVLGGHSADVLRVAPAVTGFVADAWERGVLVGALECGQMVLMSAGIIDGQRVTGYRVVRPFLSRLGTFVDEPVVVDGNLITGRDSDATPSFVRALARYFQPDWEDPTVDLLAGKRIVIVAGQDFEDVELCVPASMAR
jgi:putative intracellular protease/amidase